MSDEQFRDDELVSAYLDGEATPAEIAEVEQNDVLMARIEQLRSVRDAVAAPVAPMSAERREQMISAALAVSDAGNVQRHGARIVPIRRRRETLLAVAAAAVLLAAVVSAGLIASRGGDDDAEMAADAPAEAAEVEATDAAPAEADMAMADDSADYEMAAEPVMTAAPTEADMAMAEEEPMADEEPMAELEAAPAAADVADEAAAVELEAAMAAAEAESAMEAPAEEAADSSTSAAEADQEGEEERRTTDEAAVPVVDLGAFENLESLFDDVTARWSAALENGATADSGTCSAAVRNKELESDVETGQPFVAAVGTEEPLIFDGRFARRSDGTAIIIYAAPPDCEIETHNLDAPDGS